MSLEVQNRGYKYFLNLKNKAKNARKEKMIFFSSFKTKLNPMSLEVQNRELQIFFQPQKQSKKRKKRKNDILFQILSLDPLTLERFLTHFEQKTFFFVGAKNKKTITFLQNLPNFCVRNRQNLWKKISD